MKYTRILAFALLTANVASAQNTDSANIYYKKGLEEKAARRYLVASKYLDTAIRFNKNFKEAYLENANVSLEMRKTDDAKKYFTKVYELEPGNKDAIRNLSELYFDYRQFQKAIEFANMCKDCPKSERIIAISSYHSEDYGKSIAGLKNVLAKDPADAEGTYIMARSYLDMEDYKNAVPWYNKAVALDVTKNTWMYELGLLNYTINDYKSAAAAFVKAGENGYPKGNDYAENLGYAYIYSGEFEKGEKLLLEVMSRKPGNKDMMRDIAEAYYNAKQYDKSLEFCQKLMELDAKDGKALYQAGMCFQKMGQKDKGQGMCDKAIELDPSLASMRQKQMSAGL